MPNCGAPVSHPSLTHHPPAPLQPCLQRQPPCRLLRSPHPRRPVHPRRHHHRHHRPGPGQPRTHRRRGRQSPHPASLPPGGPHHSPRHLPGLPPHCRATHLLPLWSPRCRPRVAPSGASLEAEAGEAGREAEVLAAAAAAAAPRKQQRPCFSPDLSFVPAWPPTRSESTSHAEPKDRPCMGSRDAPSASPWARFHKGCPTAQAAALAARRRPPGSAPSRSAHSRHPRARCSPRIGVWTRGGPSLSGRGSSHATAIEDGTPMPQERHADPGDVVG
mmetsp:Transcript_2421/g.6122  ORF Transcript_2421/g.6122 Transcript_2421/m.6122 type:complete len:274 (+) Transcript_2421:1159-1980(+)